jgi:acyl carrier protein
MAQPMDADSFCPPGEAAPDWAGGSIRGPLLRVLQLLPADARACAACVCPAWREVAADASVRGFVDFTGARVEVTDALLAALCACAGGALRELRLDSEECSQLSSHGLIKAMSAAACTGLRRLVLQRLGEPLDLHLPLTLKQAQQLAAALPALEHATCYGVCDSLEEAATVRALLPGPLTLVVRGKLFMVHGRELMPAEPPLAVRARIDAAVRDAALRTLGHGDVDADEIFSTLGMDSMSTTEFVNVLQTRLGMELPYTVVYDYPTINALGTFLAEHAGL